MPCSLIFNRLKTGDSGHWFKISPQVGLGCYRENFQAYMSLFISSTIFCGCFFFSRQRRVHFSPFCFPSGYRSLQNAGVCSFVLYYRAREIELSAFDSTGLRKQDYGLHSLRAGSASGAANARVPDRLFKRRGRWTSDKAKDD